MSRRPRFAHPLFAAATLVLAACSDSGDPLTTTARIADAEFVAGPNLGAPPPAGLTLVAAAGGSVRLWPFTGAEVADRPSDPVNLLFTGQADPRAVRAALMSLDGDRTAFGFPAVAPFDCRWSDTPSGGVQTAYTEDGGWLGGAIQLQCGDYAPIRFHLRLFRSGAWTLGGAHFEVLIPGTADHQVLSWELAEQLVSADMVRSGLLDPSAPVSAAALGPAPTFRTIPAVIFNVLPPELQAIAAGAPGTSAADVPIATNGRVTVLNVLGRATAVPADVDRTFTLQFGQVVPKPFCGGPADYLYVSGPLTLHEVARLAPKGFYLSSFDVNGQLDVVPIDPTTGQPSGAPFQALIQERHFTQLTSTRQRVSSDLMQSLLPVGAAGHGRLTIRLDVDTHGRTESRIDVQCN